MGTRRVGGGAGESRDPQDRIGQHHSAAHFQWDKTTKYKFRAMVSNGVPKIKNIFSLKTFILGKGEFGTLNTNMNTLFGHTLH